MKLRWLSIAASLAFLIACSSEKDDEGDDDDTPPAIAFCGVADSCPPNTSGVDLTTPVSFRTQVYEGVFQTSCNSQLCHGHQTLSRGGLWLGPEQGEPQEAMLATIIATLLEPSATAPELANVVPGEPDQSFLMLKLDGCQNRAGLSCEKQDGALCGEDCGDAMPQFDSPETDEVFPLSDEQRHTVRAWIAQGAQNN